MEARSGAPAAPLDTEKRASGWTKQNVIREIEAAFEVAYPGSFLGSDKSAPGSKLLARCLDMGANGKDWPGTYIDPSLCTSVAMEEEEGQRKEEKAEKACVSILCPGIRKNGTPGQGIRSRLVPNFFVRR